MSAGPLDPHDAREGETPFVTVIIPVLESPEGVRLTLEALLRQSYAPHRYEVLVTDNGSRDDTPDVVNAFAEAQPGRVRLLTELDRRSSYAARNVGVEEARGTILAFTDADCVPSPDWIANGVRTLEETGAAYAAGHVRMTFQGTEPNLWEYYDAVGKMNQRRYMERYGFGATANLFVRRDRMAEHGRFRGDLVSGGDYEFGRRLARAGEIGVYAPDAVVEHPARATARAILKKQRRIVRGRRQLEQLGALEHGRLTWRSFLPVRRCPPLAGHPPSAGRRLAFIVAANFVRYTMLVIRVAGRVAGAFGRRGAHGG